MYAFVNEIETHLKEKLIQQDFMVLFKCIYASWRRPS